MPKRSLTEAPDKGVKAVKKCDVAPWARNIYDQAKILRPNNPLLQSKTNQIVFLAHEFLLLHCCEVFILEIDLEACF